MGPEREQAVAGGRGSRGPPNEKTPLADTHTAVLRAPHVSVVLFFVVLCIFFKILILTSAVFVFLLTELVAFEGKGKSLKSQAFYQRFFGSFYVCYKTIAFRKLKIS